MYGCCKILHLTANNDIMPASSTFCIRPRSLCERAQCSSYLASSRNMSKCMSYTTVSQLIYLRFPTAKTTCDVGWASSCYVQHLHSCDNCVRNGQADHTDNSVHHYWTQRDDVSLEHVVKPLSPSLDFHKHTYNQPSTAQHCVPKKWAPKHFATATSNL